MSSPTTADDPLVLGESDDRRLLDAFAAAMDAGRTCAVVDPAWPTALREAATDQVRSSGIGRERLVLFTSGSTGSPRAVVRTHRSWVASLDALTQIIGATPDDVVHLPGPLTSSLYLYGAWHAARLGARVLVADDDASPATLVHAVPGQLARMVSAPEVWPSLRTVVVAGDLVPAPLRSAARDIGWRVVEYYGAAELSFVAWRDDDGPLRPFPGARLRVRDGVLWVASPYLAEGYLPPPGVIKHLVPPPPGVIKHSDPLPGPLLTRDGWATVGDLAREVPGGFEVLGRGSAAVTTGGHTVVAEEVEAALLMVPGVADAVVVGTPDARLGQAVAAVVVLEVAVSRQALDAALRRLPAPARPRRWYFAGALPRTAAGKPDRAAMLAAVRAGDVTPLR